MHYKKWFWGDCVSNGYPNCPVSLYAGDLQVRNSRGHTPKQLAKSQESWRLMWIRELNTIIIVLKIDMGEVWNRIDCFHSDQECFEGTHFLSTWLEIHFLTAIFFPNCHSLHVFTTDHVCLQVLKKSWNMWGTRILGFEFPECRMNTSGVWCCLIVFQCLWRPTYDFCG